jgi:response regulator RpfG family c-di-GMP phosphodiesterase
MKTHTAAGRRVLGGGRSGVIRLSEEIALSHHERRDGTGVLRQAHR